MPRGEPRTRAVRCAIYTRQSVVRAGGDPAIASCRVQYEICARHVQSHASERWTLLDERFDDEGQSGASVRRPALARLLEGVSQGRVDRVVVYRLDRLTRRVSDWALLKCAFEQRGAMISVVAEGLRGDDGAVGRLQLNMLATLAEFERDMISDRVREAHAAHRAAGLRSAGRLPVGYVADPKTKQLVIDERGARVVRFMFERAAQGVPPGEIVVEANRRKIYARADGAAWQTRTVLRVLRNPVYAGLTADMRPAPHRPIIERDIFDRVAHIIEARRTRSPTGRASVPEADDPFMLRGLLACGRCGALMTTSAPRAMSNGKPREAKRQRRYYRCRHEGCQGAHVAAKLVEQMANDAITHTPEAWPEQVRVALRALRRAYEKLAAADRRVLIADLFERLEWNPQTEDLLMAPSLARFATVVAELAANRQVVINIS